MIFGNSVIRSSSVRSRIVLASLTVLLVVMAALVVTDRNADTQTLDAFVDTRVVSIPQIAPRVARPSSLWIGDSFTQGGAAYPRIVCAELGWYCNIDAQGGTGFTHIAPEVREFTRLFIERVPTSAERYKADLIIIDGGRNDMSINGEEVTAAMRVYLGAVTAAWPDAKVVIIVPFRLETEPSYEYSAFLPGIRDVADSFGAAVLDPYAEGWFVGADLPAMVIEDEFHPNAQGNSYIAAKLEASLERAHVVTPGAPNGGMG